MSALTAGAAITVAHLCLVVTIAGLHYAAPAEKCTRYWALSSLLIATAVLMLVANAGVPRHAILLVGNSILIFGAILQWWGIQVFYKKQPGRLGWGLGAAFVLLFGWLLREDAGIAERALLASAGMIIVLGLGLREVWSAQRTRWSFGGAVALGAIALLCVCCVLRIAAYAAEIPEFLPMTDSLAGIVVVYLLPLAGSLLYFSGLFLLYFQQIVEDKHYLATHDELTGILNRRAVIAAGAREAEVAARFQQPLAIAFVAIDSFRQMNDQFGQEAGDTVLSEVAQILRRTCRSIDLVGRYSGVEFLLVFPGVNHESAAIVGKKLLDAVRQYRFKGAFPVTVSVGLAAMPSGENSSHAWQRLVNKADVELHRAKTAGRNRLCISF